MRKYKKNLIFILILGLAALLVYYTFVVQFPDLWKALKSGKEADIEAFLMDNDRIVGTVCLGFLQIVQVISIVIPGAPIQLAGGMVYGAIRGYIICHLSYVLSNIIVIACVRNFSGLNDMLGKSEKEKIQKALSYLNKDDPFVTVLLLCMIPVIPNGIIPYAASHMDIDIKSFAFAVFLGSIYPIGSLAVAGKLILSGDYIISGIIVLLNVVIVAWLFFKRNQVSDYICMVRAKHKEKRLNKNK